MSFVIITVYIFNNIFMQAYVSVTLLPQNEERLSPGNWSVQFYTQTAMDDHQ